MCAAASCDAAPSSGPLPASCPKACDLFRQQPDALERAAELDAKYGRWDEKTLTFEDFHTLGRITAALHDHSKAWTRPPGFGRFAWDWPHSLGDQPRWGRWQDAIGVGETESGVLDRAGLYGVLAELEALGLDLLEVRQLTSDREPPCE